MRALRSVLIMGILAACAPAVPNSGVGFDNSDEVQRAREAALNTGQSPLVPASVLSGETTSGPLQAPLRAEAVPTVLSTQPVAVSSGSSDDIAAETAAALASASTTPNYAPSSVTSTSLAPVNTAGISDENNFAAVSARQTIASDADRIAQNREQYQIVEPTALPTRASGGSQPNIVDFALSTNNTRGSKIYSRSGFSNASKAARNCAKFASPDMAQSAFLSSGGPQKDRKGLDPDGDGFACSWDPAPFRQAGSN